MIFNSFSIIAILFYLSVQVLCEFEFIATNPEAKCLDGSPHGIFYRKGTNNKFVIYMEAENWCGASQMNNKDFQKKSRDEILNDCFQISQKQQPIQNQFKENGIKNKLNPIFKDHSIAVMISCDGMGFQGHKQEAIKINDEQQIWIRGDNNAKAGFFYMFKHLDLNQSDEVILMGSSIGGVAAMQWLEFFKGKLYQFHKHAQNVKLSLVLDSALFLENENYQDLMKSIVEISNEERIHPQVKCAQNYSDGEQQNCFLPEILLNYINVPTYILQSSYDTFQSRNLMGIDCVKIDKQNNQGDMNNCSVQELDSIHQIKKKTIDLVYNLIGKNKNWGAYVIPCAYHNFLNFDNILDNNQIRVFGQTPAQSLTKWLENNQNSLENSKIDAKFWPANKECCNLNQQKFVEQISLNEQRIQKEETEKEQQRQKNEILRKNKAKQREERKMLHQQKMKETREKNERLKIEQREELKQRFADKNKDEEEQNKNEL